MEIDDLRLQERFKNQASMNNKEKEALNNDIKQLEIQVPFYLAKTKPRSIFRCGGVIYFEQLLGAAHSKNWLKYTFFTFFFMIS